MKKSVINFLTIVALFIHTTLSAQQINWNNEPARGFVYEINNDEAKRLLLKKDNDSVFKELLHTQVDTFDVEKGWTNRPGKGHFILVTIKENKLYCSYTCVYPYQVILFREYGAFSLQVLDVNGNVREDALVKIKHKRIKVDTESKTYRIENKWFKGVSKIATVELDGFMCVFDIERHRVKAWNNSYNYDEGPQFYSYMITDKNKYRPGEQVRFKSYILSYHKSPLRKKLEIVLSGNRKNIRLGQIDPHRPGSYAGGFHLHDSLNISLDNNYAIQLRDKQGQVIASCTFNYEDYELFGNNLDIQLAKDFHYHPDTNILTIKATDVNGLLLKDAKAEVKVRVENIRDTYKPYITFPNSVLDLNIDLDPDNPTIIEIPSSLFDKSNSVYKVEVVVLNTQNERMLRGITAIHYYSHYQLTEHYSNDSICFNLLYNNEVVEGVPAIINRDDNTVDTIILPYAEKINPSINYYKLHNEYGSKQITLSHFRPQLNINGGIEQDSFKISLNNPHKINVSYYIYQGDNLIHKGAGEEINYSTFIEERLKSFHVDIIYSFGGKEHTLRRKFQFQEDNLDIDLDMPERIYPGQTVNATITVTDQLGNPVKGVDLTALATTSKLNYYLPDLPYYGTSSKSRIKADYYSKFNRDNRTAILDLPYKEWKYKAGLDTMAYYQLLYPDTNAFRHSYKISDSTQFAPYIVRNGTALNVFVIEVDNNPVYFSWTNQPKKYSFYVNPDKKHNISFRLSDMVLEYDSVQFDSGMKTILSIDIDKLPQRVSKTMLNNEFSKLEVERYKSRIAVFKSATYQYSYLDSEQEFIPLFNKVRVNNNRSVLVGPLYSERKRYNEGANHIVNYKHVNGYNYLIEENVVYKTDYKQKLPQKLYERSFHPSQNLNDLKITKSSFIEQQKQKPLAKLWYPRNIHVNHANSQLKILLPHEVDASGLATVVFHDCATGKVIFPWDFTHRASQVLYDKIPFGKSNVFALYNNGTYLKMNNIKLDPGSISLLNFKQVLLNEADSLSKAWLLEYKLRQGWHYEPVEEPQSLYRTTFYNDGYGNVNGTIFDESGEFPLPGASIVIKGTNTGAVSDMDGKFSLSIDDVRQTIVILYIGYKTQEIEVEIGSHIEVFLIPDFQALEEVVVTALGYTRSEKTLGYAVTSTSNVNMIQEEEDEPEEEENDINNQQEAEQKLYNELLNLNSIRKNFSDVGFWEPRLFTDKNGQSNFEVTFPDDITKWEAVVYAMNKRLQTGTARKSIKSYKPLMAELHTPRFLVRGDSAMLVGKILNYTSDSLISGITEWNNADTTINKEVQLTGFYSDKLLVEPLTTDSITGKYLFTRTDGYMDGEERTIPVVKQGTIRANGTLEILKNGDVKYVKASDDKTVTIEIIDNQVDIYAQEVQSLVNYRYACNEQLASKLIGLINLKYIKQFEGKHFHHDRHVNKIITKLVKNQNKEFLWSWWNKSDDTSYWMSAHILRALKYAREAGYTVNINVENIASKAGYQFNYLKKYDLNDVALLHSIAHWNVEIDYKKHLVELDSIIHRKEKIEEAKADSIENYQKYSYLKEKLLLMEVRQLVGDTIRKELLLENLKKGIKGEVWFSDGLRRYYWYNNNLTTNAIAYRIILRDPELIHLKESMQMYFLSTREKGLWNTYHSSNVVMSVLPELLKDGLSKETDTKVILHGKENSIITSLPYRTELKPNEELTLEKQEGLPVYLSKYTNERVTEAKTGVEGFKIRSFFEHYSDELKAGQPIKLIVEVEVLNDASSEYVMINIPIPGSCSYVNKKQVYWGVETHREYFKEQTVIFCKQMEQGKYRFEIDLLPRFTGKYILNPAQVSLMYVPVVNSNTAMKSIYVKE